MINIVSYNVTLSQEWNRFVKNAKNTHFMFDRGYMDYHSDKFEDFSLMFYYKNRLVAVLPANKVDNIIYSHQGLTFGGMIFASWIQVKQVILCFEACIDYLRNAKVEKFCYKCIPYIYHRMPADEDRYALFLSGFKLVRRELSTSIFLENRLTYPESRKGALRKARNNQLVVRELDDFAEFWKVLEKVLIDHHQAKPVHSYREIQSLKDKFPESIRLFVTVNDNGDILAGVVIYISYPVVHTQYLASSVSGRLVGALDLVVDHVLNLRMDDCPIFDFGTSSGDGTAHLNEGLIYQKESFGARGIVHDFYELQL